MMILVAVGVVAWLVAGVAAYCIHLDERRDFGWLTMGQARVLCAVVLAGWIVGVSTIVPVGMSRLFYPHQEPEPYRCAGCIITDGTVVTLPAEPPPHEGMLLICSEGQCRWVEPKR